MKSPMHISNVDEQEIIGFFFPFCFPQAKDYLPKSFTYICSAHENNQIMAIMKPHSLYDKTRICSEYAKPNYTCDMSILLYRNCCGDYNGKWEI